MSCVCFSSPCSKVAELDKRVHVVEEELTRREQIIQQKVKELVFASLREKLLQQQLQVSLEFIDLVYPL